MSDSKIYCLWGSCHNFDLDNPKLCSHDDYICVDMTVCAKSISMDLEPGMLTLEQAKKAYPTYKFCEDWVAEKQTVTLNL